MNEYRKVIDVRRRELGAWCLQDWDELAELAPHIERVQPRTVVEIGSCEFGWPYLMAPYFALGALIVGIDPLTKLIIRRDRVDATMARLRSQGFAVEFLHGRSDDDWVMGFVQGIAEINRVDVLHIDGAHDYDTCRQDWLDYSGYVRAGGLVIFHDVRSRAAGEKVFQVWDEIRAEGKYKTTEIGKLARVGIGIVEI